MNERIQKLFEQAHIQPQQETGGQFTWTPPKTFDPEVFAELIVFECIKLAVFNGDSATARTIKQHFGVNE